MATFLKLFYIETPQEVEACIEVTIDVQEDDGDRSVGQEPSVSYSVDEYRIVPEDGEPTPETVAFFAAFNFEKYIDDNYGYWIDDYYDNCYAPSYEEW